MRTRSLLLALFAVLLVARDASAQTEPTPVAPPPPLNEGDRTAAPAPASSPAPAQPMVALPVAATSPVAPASLALVPAEPLAGYTNGSFFVRDPHNWFVFFPRARLQIDAYTFLNRGSAPEDIPAGADPNSSKDPRPKDTIFVRRARAEFQGTVIGHFDFHIAAEYASTPATGSTGIVSDAYIIVDYLSYLKVQAGQFDAPFTMENRTSDKYIDFMERSLTVRSFAVPGNKDQGAMVFGWLPKHFAYYSFGVFNGDGQSFKNQDSHPALIGRAFVAPLAFMGRKYRWLEDLWVGGSIWWKRSVNEGGAAGANVTGAAQNDIASMSTQGGFGFFSTNYGNGTDAANNAIRSHLAPWGNTLKWAVEANVPLWKFIGARFELVHQSIEFARYDDTNTINATLVRAAGQRGGKLDGTAYYLELYGWILGDMSMIETPGLEPAPRYTRFNDTKKPRWGLMVAAKYEHVGFDVSGLNGTTNAMGAAVADPASGHYSVHAFELGLNAWGTKHVRLSANYVLNYIDGDSSQVKKNYFFQRPEHELLFRIGINL